jgi:nitroimidazol reductase NimA-like FMN-containing flavoprotein (pyridoxamine 5'-phosphate oxidase superfamily)
MMRINSSVCFEVDEIVDQYNWKSVILNGHFEEVTDNEEIDKLRPHYTEYRLRKRASLPVDESAGDIASTDIINDSPVFFRIQFTNVSGRFQDGFS